MMEEDVYMEVIDYMGGMRQYTHGGSTKYFDNGHNDFNDENTIILCVELTDGLLLSHGTRYEF